MMWLLIQLSSFFKYLLLLVLLEFAVDVGHIIQKQSPVCEVDQSYTSHWAPHCQSWDPVEQRALSRFVLQCIKVYTPKITTTITHNFKIRIVILMLIPEYQRMEIQILILWEVKLLLLWVFCCFVAGKRPVSSSDDVCLQVHSFWRYPRLLQTE